MLESLNMQGRSPKTSKSIERRNRIDQMPTYIKARVNARKVILADAIKNVEPCASQASYRKKINQVRKQASWTEFTEAKSSMDAWWINFCRLGLTQNYVDGIECMERGINLSTDEQSRFLQAEKLLNQKLKSNSRKASEAINARWSNDPDHNNDKQKATELMRELLRTKLGRSLSTRSCARWLAAKWPVSNKPSFRSLQRYADQEKCANTGQ